MENIMENNMHLTSCHQSTVEPAARLNLFDLICPSNNSLCGPFNDRYLILTIFASIKFCDFERKPKGRGVILGREGTTSLYPIQDSMRIFDTLS